MTAVQPRPIAVWAAGGRCTVCWQDADSVVVYRHHREIWHEGGAWRCVLPNPPNPSREDGAS
jgi:hypothetical protein